MRLEVALPVARRRGNLRAARDGVPGPEGGDVERREGPARVVRGVDDPVPVRRALGARNVAGELQLLWIGAVGVDNPFRARATEQIAGEKTPAVARPFRVVVAG